MQPIAWGFFSAISAMSSPSWKPGLAPRHPHHPVAEALMGERLAVGSGRQRDPGVRVQVVDVCGRHESVHGRVDRRSRATRAVQAVVEGRHHLVLALDAGVDVDEGAQPVQSKHGQPGLGERAEVATRPLDPEQLDGLGRDRVDRRALGRGVAPGVVRVARVGAQPVGALDERGDLGDGHAPTGLLAADPVSDDRRGSRLRGMLHGVFGVAPARAPSASSGTDVGVEGVHEDFVRTRVRRRPSVRSQAPADPRAARASSSPGR